MQESSRDLGTGCLCPCCANCLQTSQWLQGVEGTCPEWEDLDGIHLLLCVDDWVKWHGQKFKLLPDNHCRQMSHIRATG